MKVETRWEEPLHSALLALQGAAESMDALQVTIALDALTTRLRSLAREREDSLVTVGDEKIEVEHVLDYSAEVIDEIVAVLAAIVAAEVEAEEQRREDEDLLPGINDA